jgi:phosphate transport system substrate-binding protein
MQLRGIKSVTAIGGVAAVAVALAACSSSTSPSSGASGAPSATASSNTSLSGTIDGAGSTFQANYQDAAIQAFKSVDPGITVNYSGVGSGTGRQSLYSNTVLFAGSDSTIPTTETADLKGRSVLYFPILIGPITLSYNLSNVGTLKLSPTVIADIFQGKITNWSDSAIKSLNPGVSLPNESITLAVRSDSSGTTQNFSLFLEKSAGSAWSLGSASTIKWPSTAHAAQGNPGVAQVIKSTPGAIGYVDYSTAQASGLHAAEIENKAGDYVAPSINGATTDASAATVSSALTFHAVWASSAPTAYPITYQTWDIVYAKQPNASDASLLKAYIGYLIGQGQSLLTTLYYAPLPSNIDASAKAQLSQITG